MHVLENIHSYNEQFFFLSVCLLFLLDRQINKTERKKWRKTKSGTIYWRRNERQSTKNLLKEKESLCASDRNANIDVMHTMYHTTNKICIETKKKITITIVDCVLIMIT